MNSKRNRGEMALDQTLSEVPEFGRGGGQSNGQVIKSSLLIGGALVLRIGLGIVRAKAMALILGPAGISLLRFYSAIADLAQSVAGMGSIAAESIRSLKPRAHQTPSALRIPRRLSSVLPRCPGPISSKEFAICFP